DLEHTSLESNFNTIPELLTSKKRVALSSDVFLPFLDNIYQAHQSGADSIADPS
ncbi:40107_t:CDS:2, partial [Gigaspora margarita]